ncbi:MAG: hypothetical protein L3K11_02265 [Thermoplasmata archaeon]|nr:hypothetical protein [Thermoplasmata archaeon]
MPRAKIGSDLERRVDSIVRVAGEHRTTVPVEALIDLLPEEAPTSPAELEAWLREHPEIGALPLDGQVGPPGLSLRDDLRVREARAARYTEAAVWLFAQPLSSLEPLIQCAAVTGSVAFGRPEAGDDCDLMVVTRRGALWVFLTFTFLRLRSLHRPASSADAPEFCLNYIVDEDSAEADYATSRGLLFAREALTVRLLLGDPYYRSLLARASWLQREAPRLYARWQSTSSTPMDRSIAPVAATTQFLNLLLFPLVASYLQLKGLLAGHRLRRAGLARQEFRTITGLGRMTLRTLKFERLRSTYGSALDTP